MAPQTSNLWLLLVVMMVMSQGCCQHWSYGLSPGGKRDLDSLSDTLGDIIERFPHADSPCSVLGCAEEPPFPKMYRMKGFIGSGTDRDNGHRTYKK
ncbi:progonadoliberin-1 [Pagrus major]|uniref:Progonadoliberin-1 n=2 Tax=Pagrus major TaxID=143350 RepID=GON1_PAGMA|nr:RecName: Full=Progonadoliberin-1; AltName: Full=Progonadoliberin I; Contains: RecName: Full=Gonadoliberin-1; AltName: Full=Gonadoliberin I; AltName: Full=Gonadotropin-releasing hormone I; Short=GnRH-I; AltName: Full=Luliberin I; AltName: Full=Luteinizing hormone-releasing hormone I; Short=LH-RH I; Contains: RecName: Full=GnRH-associated peptide 1; AltName: Full=GnRH-associated peptide I; Flags: Precursor [Pagrus major]BAA13129.1 gonadotropin-releasing hormone [Pagrus major]